MHRFLKTISESKIFKYGILTNTVIGIVLRGTGDVIQQKIEINHTKNLVTKSSNENKELVTHINWTRTS